MATLSRSRSCIVLVGTTAALAGAAPALAAHHTVVRGCGAPAGSAINEYCDSFPTSTGGTVPKVGSPAVATTLPATAVRQISSGPTAERKLLTVPADPKRKRPRHHQRHPVRTASLNAPTSVWSLALTLILILVGIALVLAALAAERWRRGRA